MSSISGGIGGGQPTVVVDNQVQTTETTGTTGVEGQFNQQEESLSPKRDGDTFDATGGTYARTHELTGLATRALARTIAGHYVLTLDVSALPAEGGKVRVGLRNRREIVLVRPVSVR